MERKFTLNPHSPELPGAGQWNVEQALGLGSSVGKALVASEVLGVLSRPPCHPGH